MDFPARRFPGLRNLGLRNLGLRNLGLRNLGSEIWCSEIWGSETVSTGREAHRTIFLATVVYRSSTGEPRDTWAGQIWLGQQNCCHSVRVFQPPTIDRHPSRSRNLDKKTSDGQSPQDCDPANSSR